jgi:hypothetical protein
MRGIEMPSAKKLAEIIGLNQELTLVGVSFATSKVSDRTTINCDPSVFGGNQEYVLQDISVPSMAESQPIKFGSIGNGLAIAGVSSPSENRGHYHYWIWRPNEGHAFLDAGVQNELGICFLPDYSVVVTTTG